MCQDEGPRAPDWASGMALKAQRPEGAVGEAHTDFDSRAVLNLEGGEGAEFGKALGRQIECRGGFQGATARGGAVGRTQG